MIRSESLLRTLVAFGVVMLLTAWAIRRFVLPDPTEAAGPAAAVVAFYARNYAPSDLVNVKELAPACNRGELTACTSLGRQIASLRMEFPEFAPGDCLERGLFQTSCDGGEMRACTELTHALRGCPKPDSRSTHEL